MRADAVGYAIGLAVDDPHAAVIDPERVGADLRHGRREALPDIRAAGHQFHRPGRVNAAARAVGAAEPALIDKDREPGADQSAGIAPAAPGVLQSPPSPPRPRPVEQPAAVAGTAAG